jgi:predicted DNA-binding transcriptional regulator AlpA
MSERWPRAMKADAAAEYCGLGLSSFHRYVAAGIAPAPIRYPACDTSKAPRRVAWLREDLDAWLDRMAGRTPASADDAPWPVENGSNHAALPANIHRPR